MPRFPRPWSKKRGKRFASTALRGVAGEVVFYTGLFLSGVFLLSLVLINRFAPDRVVSVSPQALSGSWNFWIFGVLSLAAIGSGVGGLIYRLSQLRTSSERRSAIAGRAEAIEIIGPNPDRLPKLPTVPRGQSLTDSPGERQTYRLAPERPHGSDIAGPAVLALLWNSVWFVLLAVVVSGFWFGRPRLVLMGLLFPFAGIGIWSFRSFVRQLRQTAGIGPTIVEISNHPLIPGQQYRLFVSQAGRLRLRKVSVCLTCEEETFYRQGTDVRVERHEAFTQEILTEGNVRVDPQAPWEQQLVIDLPPNAMHSFVGSHNAIRWKIVVSGEARPWPSFCQSFPVVVHPPGVPLKRSPR
ncbi:hypothetical protein [Stieleria marina]|uniref:DUF3592 domain-containing protein n=1 Tax=Stieleria marina TaxID=1930275 RepID=A0A517P1J4_9BACT|nr:hypothetical protein K239x_52420 [Planctomycetes bacterium K23_9]